MNQMFNERGDIIEAGEDCLSELLCIGLGYRYIVPGITYPAFKDGRYIGYYWEGEFNGV